MAIWVYKASDVEAGSAENMWKEEGRWKTRFDGDEETLYAFLKVLAMACAVETVYVNEYSEGYLQAEYTQLMVFLRSERREEKKKLS